MTAAAPVTAADSQKPKPDYMDLRVAFTGWPDHELYAAVRDRSWVVGEAANDELTRRGFPRGARSADGHAAVPPLLGIRVATTGKMTGPLDMYTRAGIAELIINNGGYPSRLVNADTGLLVTWKKGRKYKAAADLGVKIVSPEEFAEMLGR